MKSFHIITFGCQMNEHDSERMTGIRGAGLCVKGRRRDSRHGDPEHVQHPRKAEQKFFSELGRLKS
jgi:hypothetical protein